ncbi:MAG: radical SAM/SPASM domain-containing protein [Candidatus Omnitrophota bacterium]
MLTKMLKEADLSNFPNHIVIYGQNFAQETLTEEYSAYRREWVDRAKNYYAGDFPLHLDIEVTNNCNLRCTMCFVDFSLDKGKFIDINLFKKIIDEAAQYKLPSIKFNYRGEPLLHKQLVEMVKYAKGAGIIETQFNTNATLLNDANSEQLITAGLDKIIVSIDSIHPEKYNKIRVGANFEQVVKNIKRFAAIKRSLKKNTPVLRVQMVCMQENQDEIDDFIAFWRDTADQIGLNRYKKPRNQKESRGIVDYAQQAGPCPQIFQRLVIGCDGKVTMCCGDTSREVVLGDAYKTPVARIWQGETLNNIRRMHREYRFDEIAPCRLCSINWHSQGEEWNWLPGIKEYARLSKNVE